MTTNTGNKLKFDAALVEHRKKYDNTTAEQLKNSNNAELIELIIEHEIPDYRESKEKVEFQNIVNKTAYVTGKESITLNRAERLRKELVNNPHEENKKKYKALTDELYKQSNDLKSVTYYWTAPNDKHEHWAKQTYWEPFESAILLLDRNPSILTHAILTDKVASAPYDVFQSEYVRTLQTINRSAETGEIQKKCPPLELIAWADKFDIYVPEALRVAVERVHGKATDWEAEYQEAQKTITELKNQITELETQLENAKSTNNKLNPKTERTYKQSIYVLARLQYGWPDANHPYQKAEEIIQDSIKEGIKPPSKNTLSTQLEEAFSLGEELKEKTE